MAKTYRQQHLAIMAQNERDMRALFRDLHTRIMAHVTRAATGDDGTIPPQNSDAVRAAVSTEVLSTFVTQQNAGLMPFQITAGRVFPVSPYMRVLWPLMEQAVKVAVAEQGAIMNRALRHAPDVREALLAARGNPLVASRRVQEQTIPRDSFLSYDPLHRFVDPRGYRLSDRIWDTATTTRRKIDQLLAEMIAEGRGSLEISRELEAFVLPGRSIVRTNKPYGTTASHDSMRLARTEITAAAGRSGMMAAGMNPFVVGGDWVRSSSRSLCSSGICDELAAGSPYTLDTLPDLPGSSHPMCMCTIRWRLAGEMPDIIAGLRAEIAAPRAALERAMPGGVRPVAPLPALSLVRFVTPLLVERFARMLLDEPDEQPEELW